MRGVDDSPLDPTLQLWANGEPNNQDSALPGEADCAAIATEILQARWRDQACATPNPFVCETAEP